MMTVRTFSAAMLAVVLMAGGAVGQTTPQAEDPHHTAGTENPALPNAAGSDEPTDPAGPGMDSQGAGPGMMMSAEMMQMMMQMMAQHHVAGSTPGPGIQDGMTGAVGQGSEVVFGLAPAATPETTPDVVRGWLQTQLDSLQNPRLTLGTIETATDGSIIAEIRTVDGALVQRLSFNRYPGFVRQID